MKIDFRDPLSESFRLDFFLLPPGIQRGEKVNSEEVEKREGGGRNTAGNDVTKRSIAHRKSSRSCTPTSQKQMLDLIIINNKRKEKKKRNISDEGQFHQTTHVSRSQSYQTLISSFFIFSLLSLSFFFLTPVAYL